MTQTLSAAILVHVITFIIISFPNCSHGEMRKFATHYVGTPTELCVELDVPMNPPMEDHR
jgi:hypothetical protein